MVVPGLDSGDKGGENGFRRWKSRQQRGWIVDLNGRVMKVMVNDDCDGGDGGCVCDDSYWFYGFWCECD